MSEIVLDVKNLRKLYPVPRGWLGTLRREPRKFVHAVDGISFSLNQGEILALVGESGSGKTTTGLCTLGLVEPTEGKIMLQGSNVIEMVHSSHRKELRRKAQMIFQDPYESLNPRQTVYQTVVEPLKVHHLTENQSERRKRVIAVLDDVGLKPPTSYLQRYPQELSGGQRQRVVIASAVIMNPLFLVADEPASMLDVSIRAEILNLLLNLRDEYKIAMLYITHDLASAAYLADQVAVMYLGVIVEKGPVQEVLNNPQHPYTRVLMSVIPSPNPKRRKNRTVLQGESPNPIDLPTGCRFHPRCPVAIPSCARIEPKLKNVGKDHQVACLLTEHKSRSL
ncbi:oligopeptide ABC transporter ATP-binding protein [candidate division KSB1 bacterium 4484_219]|nr:MAG: oligopeptide ABC transporter ATP-binding protein [candidate division KSB1 bacterium 4484_219]